MANRPLDFDERVRQKIGRASRTVSVAIRLTHDEALAVQRASNRSGATLREWSRGLLLREANRPTSDPLLTELVAAQMLLINALRPLLTGGKMTGDQFDQMLAAIKAEKRGAAAELSHLYQLADQQERRDGN